MESREPDADAVPVLRIPNVKETLDLSDLLYLNRVTSTQADRYRASQGWTVLVGSNGNPARVGNAAYIQNDLGFLVASFLMAIAPRDSRTLDPKFLFHAIACPDLQQAITDSVQGSTGLKNLSQKFFCSLEIVLLPLPEQRRIAEILDAADETIRKSEALLAKLEQVKAGLLHDLLTRGLDKIGRLRDPEANPEQFQDSPLGRIPREWHLRSLQSCCGPLITYGIVQAGPHVQNGVPYIRTGDMSGDSLQVDGLLRTSRSIARSYARSEVKAGEIVCAIRATLGKVLEVPPELDGANLTQGTARIAPHLEVCGHYLLWCLRTKPLQSQFEMAQKGTTFAEITLADLRLLLVPLPPLPEQRRIAAILDAHDARIRAERAQLDKLRQIKKGLMHDLLTGKVRVQVPQEAPAP